MTAPTYRRLPGRSNGVFYRSSLWEADDHVLLVESFVVIESYRRFFYRDIQAIALTRTGRREVTTAILGAIGLLLAAPVAFLPTGGAIPLGIIAGLFLVGALITYLRGPSCKCTLRTAVQTQALPSLRRLKTARRVIALIQPRIAAAQSTPP